MALFPEPSAVYIGAGWDTRPLRILKHIQHFIMIDACPKTQWAGVDMYEHNFTETLITYFMRAGFSIHLDDYEKLMKHAPSKQIRGDCAPPLDPFMIRFECEKTHQRISYYFNTLFPEDIDDVLCRDLYSASTLIIAGYHPHKCITNMIVAPFELVLLEGTVFTRDDSEEETIITEFHKNGMGEKISRCLYYHKEYVGETCNSIDDAVEYSTKYNKLL